MARIHVAVYDKALQKEEWAAENRETGGRYLVTFDLAYGKDPGMVGNYGALLVKLKEMSRHYDGLSNCALLCTMDTQLEAVFQVVLNHLGPNHHGFSVADLTRGEGIAYDPRNRVVSEFYAAL